MSYSKTQTLNLRDTSPTRLQLAVHAALLLVTFPFCRYFSSWIEIAEDVEDSWWQDDEKGDNKGFKGNIEVSVLQSGDLLDTEVR